MSYSASGLQVYYGGSDFVADLTEHISGPVTLVANTNTVRRQRRSSAARVGLTAKCLSLGHTVSMSLDDHDETRKVINNKDGILMLIELQPDRGFAMPVVVTAYPVTMPAGAATRYNVTFIQGEGGNAVEDAATMTGTSNVGTGEEGYLYTPGTSITRITASTAVPSGGVSVAGLPRLPEGI